MPRIDPLKLLSCLQILLSPTGGIKSTAEVKRLANLMQKFSKKLVSKVIYIQILKNSETELLGQFMTAGGWSLTHGWLQDGIISNNWPLVQELLELLLLCPVDVARLKSNSAPKLVKTLSKDSSHDGVRILATKLVEQWLKIVKGETGNPAATMVNEDSLPDSTTPEQQPVTTTPMVNGTAEPEVAEESAAAAEPEEERKPIKLKIGLKDGHQVISSSTDELKAGAEPAKVEIKEEIKEDLKPTAGESTESVETKSEVKVDEPSEAKQEIRVEKIEPSQDEKDSGTEKPRSKDRKSSKSSSSSSSSRKKSESASNSSAKEKSSKSTSSSRDRDRDKVKSKDRDKERSKSNSSSTKSSSLNKEERKRDEKTSKEADQAEKDKKTLAGLIPPPISSLGKIPRKPRTDDGTTKPAAAAAPPAAAPPPPAKKPSFSIEVRDAEKKPKTVKTVNSQFRSHGLTEEAPPPPSRKGLKKPSSLPTPGVAIPPAQPKRIASPPKRAASPPPPPPPAPRVIEKKDPVILAPPPEKKPKEESSSEKSNSSGGVKLIPAKPRTHTLVETDLFSDALQASVKKDAIKKRKRRPSNSENKASNATTPTSPIVAAPLKFYQDTLEEGGDERKKAKDDEEWDDADEQPIKPKKARKNAAAAAATADTVSPESPTAEPSESTEAPEKPKETRPPGIGVPDGGAPSILTIHRRKGPKKTLRWRPQESLEEIKTFELDETERVNVTKSFTDMKQMERIHERQAFHIARKISTEDTMSERIGWQRLVEVDGVVPLPCGAKSRERQIQHDRERTVLQALYFNKAMVPDSPAEPDMEHYQTTDPVAIPLEDVTGNPEGINDYTAVAWPEPKGEPPQQSTGALPPPGGLPGAVNSLPFPQNFGMPSPFTSAPGPFAGGTASPWAIPGPFALPPEATLPFGGAAAGFGPMAMPSMGIPPPGFMPNNFGPPSRNIPPPGLQPRGNWDNRGPGANRGNFDRRNDRRNDQPMRKGVCWNYQKYGNCRMGDDCKYIHRRD